MTEDKAPYDEHLSPPQMADRLGVSSNTIRRYLKRFKQHFKVKKKFGLHWKYPLHTLDTMRQIHKWYQQGLSRPEIDNLLAGGAEDTPTPAPDPMDVLGAKIDRLTDAITGLHTLIEARTLPGDEHRLIHEATQKMLTDIKPPSDNADMVTPDKSKKNGQTASSEKNNSVTETGKQAMDKEPGDGDKVVSFSGADDSTPPPVIPDREKDLPGYRKYVIGLILKYKDQGMKLDQIKEQLEKQGLPTFTGKPAWHIGTISKLNKDHRK